VFPDSRSWPLGARRRSLARHPSRRNRVVAPLPAAPADGWAVVDEAVADLSLLRRSVEGLARPLVPGSPRVICSDADAISVWVQRLVLQLQERDDQIDAVFALSPDGLVMFDALGRVSRVNAAFTRMTGLTADMLHGVEEAVFLFRLNTRCAAPHLLGSLESLRVPLGADPTDRSGRDIVHLQRPAPRTLKLGLYGGMHGQATQVLHLRDITREVQIDQMKSEFLATAAHELRTPMASVFGFTELLITRELTPQRRKDVLERVYRQSGAMVSILNELLDLARIESGRGMDFEFADTDPIALVHVVVHDFVVPAGREVAEVILADALPLQVKADSAKLQQLMRNLLSNAYKYSPDGGPVRITIALDTDTPGGPWVAIGVCDRGIGLSAEQLARVGERFFRVDKSGSLPGTGLGVSIVQQIAELHGGTLEIESRFGEGSTFTLRLPALELMTPSAAAAAEPGFSPAT
jgi:signal transduction histidine kinase